jgi:hypothetical protein
MRLLTYLFVGVVLCAVLTSVRAQSKGKLFFREDWKEIEAALPVTKEHLVNANLVLSLYGPSANEIKKSNHPTIPNDPYYIWSGECKGNWALALRHRDQLVDLSGDGRVRIRSRQSGFRQLRLIIKPKNGNWLVSDQYAGFTEDWTEKEFEVSTIRWRRLNIETVTEGAWDQNPDLHQVEQIGFTDLMSGGGTPASSRLDWIEVYGGSGKR